MPILPVLDHADAIRTAVSTHGRLVLVAPPGTGKSTQVPRLLLPASGTAVVLQPRRIAARSLAMRVAAEMGERPGETVGFQVRFERSRGANTRVLFETYGVFWQQLLQTPALPDVSLVILDEFHERTLEADACLAWLARLRATTRKDLAVVVMSATLAAGEIARFLDDAPTIEIAARAYPVEVEYLSPQPHEPAWTQAARGFRHLLSTGERGSVLVFMPGVGEIRRSAEAIAPAAAAAGYEVLELHGALPPEAQQRALALPEERPCVIVATNVAETSLTIPGVTAVIDSGLARQAAYDAERDLDTLHLGMIARANATQRAGRAGRVAPGRCVRLWPKGHETHMAEALPPEIERLDLTGLALAVASLPSAPAWLTPPPPDRWARAQARLHALGAVDAGGRITPLGRSLLGYPLAPPLARVLVAAKEAGCATLAAAMIALVEAADRRDTADEGDLYLLGLDLARTAGSRRSWRRDVTETYRQLVRMARPTDADQAAAVASFPLDDPREAARRRAVTTAWLAAYADRVASRQELAYHLADGRKGVPSAGHPTSPLLVALALHELGGGGMARQVGIPLYLPCEPGWLGGEGEPEVVSLWDAARQRVTQERHWRAGGLVIKKEALAPDRWDRAQMEALIVEKLLAGEARLAAWDEDVDQLATRIRLAARTWPEAGVATLDAEDMQLIYHELVAGKSSPADVDKAQILDVLREYAGWEVMARLDRAAPRTYKLPGGKAARVTYFEDAPPELSARLGDMLGLAGKLAFYEERLPVLFDILAPNYRTVQKTFDMTSFWANTYPEVKKELKRRYPKHPWP